MSDIILTSLYEQKKREFRTQGQGSERFEADMLDATNRAIHRINRDADLETAITRVTDLEATLGLDDKYEDVLSDLITVNLIDMGQRPARGEEVNYAALVRAMPDKIDGIRQDIMNKAIAADTTDEVSFVGLGALGG